MLHDNSTPRQLACDACEDNYRRAAARAAETALADARRSTDYTRTEKRLAAHWRWLAWLDREDCAAGEPCLHKRRAP